MIISTTQCRQFGHPEFVLQADESVVPDIYIQEMVETIEGMVANGSVFRPCETFQIGWMLTRVHDHSPNRLTLEEPDMVSLPIRWVPGLTHTLRQKMLQVFMLDSVSLRDDMQIPSIRQSLIACTRYTHEGFFMNRSKGSNERDSGWFVGCLDKGHDHNNLANLRSLSLYEAYLGQRGIQGFVTFPVDSMIVVQPEDGIAIFKKGQRLDIIPGSLLATWVERQTERTTEHLYPE
jgi:hypothetical protein